MQAACSETRTMLTSPVLRGGPKCLGGRAEGSSFLQLHNPRNSISITNTKGLLNMPGQNNCFLNSAVQVLWHLDIFRRSFRELCGHACMEDSCIFCALKELFAQFQYSQESALPPDALRRALAETFCDQRRFQLGFMDDAAECFENILMRIHFHIANNESEDMCSAIHCIPHQKFAMTLVEQTVCHACGATSEPLPFTQMVHYVPTSALCSQAKSMKEKNEPISNFSELLKRAGGLGDLRDCPSACGAVIQIRKTLMNRPEIVSIGLVWDSERPTIEHIMDVFKTIGMSLKLQDVFHSAVDSRWASTATHQLVGIVTYYGKHYSTFFFHTKLRVWIYFDDAAVREIGPKWEQVVEKCCKGHFQPLLLLYANPNGTPVNTTTAPRIVNVVPGQKKNMTVKESCSANREIHTKIPFHHTTSNQRRALTPNPEIASDINTTIQPRRAVTPSGELTWWEENVKDPERTEISTSQNKEGTGQRTLHEAYQKLHHMVRNPDQSYVLNANAMDCHASLKNRLMARLSGPNCTFYSAAKVNPISVESSQTDAKSHENPLDTTYISRQAVENVLKLQRQRSINTKAGHPCIGQRNSSSSLESLDNVFSLRDKGLPSHLRFDIHDAANMARRRDSGNWSGDRNSASSSSTTSLDNPYFYVIGNKRYASGPRNVGRPGETSSLTDAGYDSFSLSSSDSYPSAINNSPGKIDSRLGQIPEHVQTAFVPYDISQLQYCLKDIKSNDSFPFGFKDECDKLCAEADIFVAKSIERENVGDISMAALLSDTAAARARAAMDMPYTNSQALAMAKMKHSMCLIRSSNLHKKLKEAEVALRRKQKENALETSHKESLANSKSPTFDSSHKQREGIDSVDESNKSVKTSNCKGNEDQNSDKNIEIYATLPKRSLKKKGGLSSFVDSLTGDESSEEKHHKAKEKSPNKKSASNTSLSDREKSPKSPSCKKKPYPHKIQDSDLSDYSSEWEHTKKSALHRTYSGPTSKSELSDLSSSSTHDHPSKKQHRIRRKLMGGFMRRKNRSLPDLREGQDSGGETSRSFDDCFFTQTPVPSRTSRVMTVSHLKCQPANHTVGNLDKLKKSSNRSQTPPPYKPPPPIANSNSSPKKTHHHPHLDATKSPTHCHHSPPVPGHSDFTPKQRQNHHMLLSRDPKFHMKQLNPHLNSPHQHLDFASGSAVWLKELQLKQEEIGRKKKQQEERWIAECKPGANQTLVGSNNKAECSKDIVQSRPTPMICTDNHFTQSLPKAAQANKMTPDNEQQKSVRDLTSKFEKISFSPAGSETTLEDKIQSPSASATDAQNTEAVVHAPPLSYTHIVPDKPPRVPESFKSAIEEAKERTNSLYSAQVVSGNVYSPHLTDAQLTNVLRIGPNRGSFRNSNAESLKENGFGHSRDMSVPLETRRPDKPPDYETAIQRLELLRNDRNFTSKFYSGNCINFEDILEQAKKRRNGPKKSVTFSDKVVLVACAGDEDNDFIPNPLLERVYKQHLMQKPSTDLTENEPSSPVLPTDAPVPELPTTPENVENKRLQPEIAKQLPQSPCNLCHKKTIEPQKLYCPDCSYYMSRFQQK